MKNDLRIPTNDRMIRDAVKATLVSRHAGADAVVVEELKTARGSGRLDLAVINGRIEGIEIKSDLDTLSRLERQVGFFGAAADRMTLVVGARHISEAMARVPDWWSLVSATASSAGHISLKTVRRGRLNRDQQSQALARLLERDELVTLLEEFGLDRGFRAACYDELAERATAALCQKDLAAGVRHLLKRRAELCFRYQTGTFGKNAVICRERSD
ncbi:hypothetical protein EOA50_26325 [Mesorhizobium sp. M1A.F.Ca.IN.020.30.1.1]|uniref:sce7726 family protein n=1 Tax=unclassified Mesorhizobium TaxID=325217 RepID=UPI000FD3F2F6|nr:MULTISPECIES: sce7726 family protein [unclassified Mesorhizobium]RUV69498.1 hypothetical protein EOA50_26325 [Mesorhizobium sp. M1A.F.Ca.IN.020.30.1.1]RWG36692.1 MAG: hypothetical protein EOQ59_20325 [Mesorhizobium sp.]RWG73612.1 MAG: hypothetical protein EOQ66_07775 [Mesorhizobium sp.]TIM76585.1 MAG: sce7726 family protein [Mesorhizobium sp.]TIM86799.1 MAG: sce7726 family protein [Mesorhizobium sp.]